jgi:ParB/RepB/Spo0J family partition protein
MRSDFFGRARAGSDHGLDLDQLAPIVSGTPDVHLHGRTARAGLFDVELDALVPDPDQPRRTFDDDDIAHLAESLKTHGQQTPLVVRWDAEQDKHVVIHGEKRWRAAQLAGLTTLICVLDSAERRTDERKLLQVVEAVHRGELSPVDRARVFREIMSEHGWNANKLAQELRISHSTVSRALDVDDLDPETKAAVVAGEISAKQATQRAKKKGDKKRTSTRAFKVPGGTVIIRLVGSRVKDERFREALTAATIAADQADQARDADGDQRAAA